MRTSILRRVSLLVVTLFLASCAAPNYYKTSDRAVRRTDGQLQRIDARVKAQDTPAPVVTHRGYYVDPTPINLSKAPAWLTRRITLHGQGLPFAFYVSRLLGRSGATVSYDKTVNRDRLLSMDYQGTTQGALDKLAAKTGYAYTLQDNQIVWSVMITRTFNISFMPGTSSYLVGAAHASSRSDTSSSAGINDQQYTALKGNLSVWDDLKKTVNKLISDKGTASISEATTTMTVRDYPANVRAISNYVKKMNALLSQQVAIRVQVLELALDNNYNYGIDWSLVRSVLGTQIKLSGLLGTAANVAAPVAGAASNPSTTPVAFTIGNNANKAIVHALSAQGKLSVVTEPRVVTMNDQIAEVRITKDTAYLKEATTTVQGTSSTTTSSLTPGVITDGFSLYLLPKIQSGKIYLQISSMISTLKSISTFTSPDSTQSIQLPTMSEKMFNMRSLLRSGNTLIIAGFKQLRDETKETTLLGSKALGGEGSKRENVETVILITPTILGPRA